MIPASKPRAASKSRATSKPRAASELRVIAPQDVDLFSCTGCGRCCKLWGVMIDEDSFKRAEAFLENPPEPRPNPELGWYWTNEQGDRKYYRLTDRGRCVFLDENDRCYLHKHDPSLKSTICRNYPHEETWTPRGRELSMSFSSYGAFVHVLIKPEPFKLIEAPCDAAPTLPDPLQPAIREDGPDQPAFGWKTFFLVEKALLDSLSAAESAASLDDALVNSARFLSAIEAEGDSKNLRHKIRDGVLSPATFAGDEKISNLDSAYRLMEQIIKFRILFLQGTPMLESWCIEIQSMIDDLANGPAEEKIGRSLFYRRLRRSWFDPFASEATPVLRKFLQYKIFKKTFFLEYGFVRGFNILCFMYAVLRLRLMLNARKSAQVLRLEDLFEPIRFVEVHFAHSGKFLEFWRSVFKSHVMKSGSLSEILVRL